MSSKIKLLNIPNANWDSLYQEVIRNPFIKKKYNREKRISSKIEYIKENLPEVLSGNKYILDIGPGPGEFLEVCRFYNNKIVGIDARQNESEMGNEYLRLSMLMSERQKLPIKYIGFDSFLDGKELPFKDGELDIINSQGSIEQVFKDSMLGEPVRNHHISKIMSWDFKEETLKKFNHIFKEFNRVLKKNGIVLIFGNGAANVEEYNKNIIKYSKINGFSMSKNLHSRLHKMKKI